MKRKKYFFNIIIAFTVIVFLYSISFTSLYYQKTSQMIEYDYSNKDNHFIEQSQSQMDTILMLVKSNLQQLIASEEIINYSSNNSVNYYEITNVFNLLRKSIGVSSDMGYKIDISKDNHDIIITSDSTIYKNDYYSFMRYNQSDIKKIDSFINTCDNFDDYITIEGNYDNQYPILTIIQKYKTKQNYHILVYTSFNKNKFIPSINKDNDEIFAIIRNNDLVVLETLDKNKATDLLLSNDAIESFKNTNIDPLKFTKTKLTDKMVYFVNSKELSWTYVFVSSNVKYKQQITNLIIYSITFFLLMLILGIIFVFFLSKILYKPILKIVNSLQLYSKSDESDELSFIEKTTKQLLHDNLAMSKNIRDDKILLKEKFIRDLLYGFINNDKIIENLSAYNLTNLQNDFIIILLQFKTSFESSFSLSSKEHLILSLENIFKKISRLESVFIDSDKVAIILYFNDIIYIKDIINEFIATRESENLIAAISNVCHKVSDINKCFGEVLGILENRIVLDRRFVYCANDIEERDNNNNYFYPVDTERMLINAILSSKREEINSMLKYIIEQNTEVRMLNKNAMMQFILAIDVTINRILNQLNATLFEVFDEGTYIYMELKMCNDNVEFKNKFYSIFETIVKYVESKNVGFEDTIAQEMIDFVCSNYQKDLSLIDMSKQFNLSTSYISTIFKKYVDENFKEYLNVYRVKMAKEILKKDNTIKIKDLANMVGCNNSNTFIRIFKKYEGLSPGKYTGI